MSENCILCKREARYEWFDKELLCESCARKIVNLRGISGMAKFDLYKQNPEFFKLYILTGN